MQPSLEAPTTLPQTVHWRLVLLVKGFDDRQACELSFLRWLVDCGHLGGLEDGRTTLHGLRARAGALSS
jgi:hypothetical protein